MWYYLKAVPKRKRKNHIRKFRDNYEDFEIPNVVLDSEDDVYYNIAEGADFVDLGLPSGTLWGKYNVGASKETDAGLYFQWADIKGYPENMVGNIGTKKPFNWTDYKYGTNPNALTKYNEADELTRLQSRDDAAKEILGGSWTLPTSTQITELLENTTQEWITVNGVNGVVFDGSNDKSIFIPSTGYCTSSRVNQKDSHVLVWGKDLGSSNQYGTCLDGVSDNIRLNQYHRYVGLNIRGVRTRKNNTPKPYINKGELIVTYFQNKDRGIGNNDAFKLFYHPVNPNTGEYIMGSDVFSKIVIDEEEVPLSSIYEHGSNTQEYGLYTMSKGEVHTVVYTLKNPELLGLDIESHYQQVGEYVPETLKDFGASFSFCTDIISVTVPNTVKKIGNSTFEGCSLTNIILPSSVTNIGVAAFLNSDLQNIELNSTPTIGNNAFCNCPLDGGCEADLLAINPNALDCSFNNPNI